MTTGGAWGRQPLINGAREHKHVVDVCASGDFGVKLPVSKVKELQRKAPSFMRLTTNQRISCEISSALPESSFQARLC
jgi:hypothetical protein